MKSTRFAASILCALFCGAGLVQGQGMDKEIASLADKLGKALVAQGSKNVAAVDFTDLQGQPTELGRFLSERLAVELVSTAGVSMVDRANIKSILAEHKLTEEGLVNPANAKKLGEFAGVDAILFGNVTELDGVELMVKAISTDSAKIVAAGRITFTKTSEIQQLLNRGISSNASAATAGGGSNYQDAHAIAAKDIGSLRVVLKSVLPMKLKDQNGRSVNGIRCSFDFVSRETQRPLVVAMNATPGDGPSNAYGGYITYGSPQPLHPWVATRVGDVLRSTLVDEHGTTWSLSTPGVAGMSIVSVGRRSRFDVFSPTDIVSVLQRQDAMGTNMTRDANDPQQSQSAFVFGSTTPIPPGQSVTVIMSFAQTGGETVSGPPPSFFQIVSEIVVGVTASGTKKSYSLHNLTFDRVSLPSGDR